MACHEIREAMQALTVANYDDLKIVCKFTT